MLRMSVEKALEWAYREELPKAHTGNRFTLPRLQGNGSLQSMAALGVTIDNLNAFGVVPDFSAVDEPHAAAIALHHLVSALDQVMYYGFDRIEVLEEFVIPPGAGAYLVERACLAARDRVVRQGDDGGWVLRDSLAELTRRRAILRDCGDDWRIDEIVVDYERARHNGQKKWYRMIKVPCAWDDAGKPSMWCETETDGRDKRTQRPYTGAYNRLVLKPDPQHAVAARLEWRIWRAALDVLVEMAKDGSLKTGDKFIALNDLGLEVLPSSLPWSPWNAPRFGVLQPKVLKSMLASEKTSVRKQTIKKHYLKQKNSA